MKQSVQRKSSSNSVDHSSFFRKRSSPFFTTDVSQESPFFGGPDQQATAVQTKLTIGEPGDQYEQEADAMADQVVQRLSVPRESTQPESGFQTKSLAQVISPLVQPKCASCEQEERLQEKKEDEEQLQESAKDIQRKPIFESDEEAPNADETVQMKCAACAEEEALQGKKEVKEEAITDEVLQQPKLENEGKPTGEPKNLQAKCADCEREAVLQEKEEQREDEVEKENSEMLSRKLAAGANDKPPEDEESVQLKCAICDQENKLQPKQLSSTSGSAVPPGVEAGVSSARGGGFPIPKNTRDGMEDSFGADFSGVRLHTDSGAVKMNQQLHAQAFTQGRDIYFNSGKFNPGTRDGQHLLAHELTHTIQQGGVQRKNKDAGIAHTQLPRIAPKIQRGIIDDIASHLLTGNALLDFIVGVVAGILEWFGDLFEGIVSLFEQAFEGSIGAIIAIVGLIIVIILAVVFPEVVVPILIVLGVVLGLISMVYFLYMMTRPGLTPYERGKYLGKAIVEAALLIFTVVEAVRFVKTFAEVAKLAEGVGLIQKLRWVRQLLRFGDTVKVIEILSEVRDIEKTIELLTLVNDVEKAQGLLRLSREAGGIDTLLELLRMEGITADDVIEFMRFAGMTLPDLRDLLRTQGMTPDLLREMFAFNGMTASRLKTLLAVEGMTVEELTQLLRRPGMTVDILEDVLSAPGMTINELKDLLGRAGMTPADLQELLGHAGMSVTDLKDLLRMADDVGQLKELLNLAPSVADLKDYFSLAGGTGHGGELLSILRRADALGDVTRVEELLIIADSNGTKFTELVQALDKFGLTAAPGGTPAALHGYSGINLQHFQARHTYEFFDFAGAIEHNPIKASNTLWPAGTDVATKVEEALTILDRMVPPQRIPPFANPPVIVTLADGARVQIGVNNANIVGQFFPLADPAKGIFTFVREEMQAFKRLLLP